MYIFITLDIRHMYPIMANLGSPLFSKQSLLVVMRRNYQELFVCFFCIYRTNSQKLTELNDKCLITQITSFFNFCMLSVIDSSCKHILSLGQLFLKEKKNIRDTGATICLHSLNWNAYIFFSKCRINFILL